MSTHDGLERGRDAFARRAWRDACELLAAADAAAPLAPEDLERLATTAYLVGRDDASVEAWTRAHHEHLLAGNVPRAARCAFWLILELLSSGEWARAGGWLAASRRLLDEGRHDCAERGLLLVLAARGHLKDRDEPAAQDAARKAAALGDRFGDPELTVFARLSQALALTRRGEADAAVTLLDEVMVGVTTREVSPIAVGTVYCAVIEACYEILDIGRAREWTDALSQWCASQPELVPFRGHCLVHRAETMRLCGAWSSAAEEAEHACRRASRFAGNPIGAAFYELAEIHRMRGRFDEAEEAYRRASEHGRSPEPGLALLRLAQGRIQAAETAIRRALERPQSRRVRADVLAGGVEILIAARDLTTARAAVEELSAMAAGLRASFLRALSAQTTGALLLAEGSPRGAFDALRAAWMEWQAIEVPYEAARVRAMMGLACRRLGDEDAAELEFSAARQVFGRLGAAPDVARVDGLLDSPPVEADAATPLTTRELQVIRLIAAGRTNRAIAGELAISERTVDRHVSNILTKLDLSSRSAATAYAYEHGLV